MLLTTYDVPLFSSLLARFTSSIPLLFKENQGATKGMLVTSYFHLVKNVFFFLFSPVGFKGNLSLVEVFIFCIFSRGLKQMQVYDISHYFLKRKSTSH